MDHGTLVKEEIDAGAVFARGFDHYAPIKAAFWLKASGDDFRYLYLTSDRIDNSNRYEAYGEVVRLAQALRLADLDLFRIKIVAGDNPLAEAAAEQILKYPDSTGRRFGSCPFGDLFVDDGYVYPQSLPVAA